MCVGQAAYSIVLCTPATEWFEFECVQIHYMLNRRVLNSILR